MRVVEWHVDSSEVQNELTRLQGHPTRALIELERTLAETFMATQLDVHVISGSLRGSGKSESDYDTGQWEGSITYGGPSPGFINNPVEYAFYEWRRGGLHDFLRSTPMFREAYARAVERHFDPEA